MGLAKIPARSKYQYYATPQMMKLIRKADAEVTAEGGRQIDILYHAMAIALYRYHGWRGLRIERLVKVSLGTYDDCAKSSDISMIELLWRETGIDLVREDTDRPWYDVVYLSSEHDTDKQMTGAQVLAMLQGEKKWIPCQITAAILLSLHRKEGWGDDRLFKFFQELQEVKAEFHSNPETLKNECDKLTGFIIADDKDLRKGNANNKKEQ